MIQGAALDALAKDKTFASNLARAIEIAKRALATQAAEAASTPSASTRKNEKAAAQKAQTA